MMDPPCVPFLIFLTATIFTPSQVWLLVEAKELTSSPVATISPLASGPKAIPCNIPDTAIPPGYPHLELC